MTRAIVSAARNLARSPGRSLSLLALMCAAFLAIVLIRAGYADMFERVKASVAREDGDLSFSRSDGGESDLAEYESLRARLASDGRFRATRASVPIDGLVGLGDRSAPASGQAVEDSGLAFEPAGRTAEARIGVTLARTLAASPGDELTALIGDTGYNLKLVGSVSTKAATLDRFYIELPLEALSEEGSTLRVDRIRIWFRDPSAPRLEAIRELSAWPELAGYEPSAYELGNTVANSIVGVYEGSFRVVLVAVALATLLALGNATLLSSWERGPEWGTMLALGAPFSRVASALVLEAFILSAAACAAGAVLSLAICAIANLAGGLTFPPPPTQTEPVVVRFKLEATALALALGLSLACAAASALVAAIGIKRRSVTELLFERN